MNNLASTDTTGKNKSIKEDQYIILFDGVCNFCNSSINFIIDRDKKNRFVFGTLQSEKATPFLRKFNISTEEFESIVLIKKGKIFKKSAAVFEIVRDLSGLWPVFYIFKIIPPFLRDPIYNLIAKNRYRLFGKMNECRIPTPELKQKFL